MINIKTVRVGALRTCCYIVSGDDGIAVIIDPGAEPGRIEEALEKEGLTPSAILLTHGHFDHIGAVDELVKKYGIPVYINREDEELLTDPEKNVSTRISETDIICLTPAVTFGDGDVLSFGSLKFRVMHTPGHTKGCSCFFAGDVVFTGDTLFHGGYGRTDVYGGSSAVLRESLRRLLPEVEGKEFYPGH
ncbi:MAG: MBL fold metallo-hydrolase [Clostridia bacterium]|nr:MBL fold metallo-hydrolase [Clostridia bacterium]